MINMNYKEILIIILIVAIVFFGSAIFFTLTGNHTNPETLRIDDVNIVPGDYGYKLKSHITPLKDFDYIEARVEFYDNNGVLLDKDSTAWNIVHAKSAVTLSIDRDLYFRGTPSYAVVSYHDSIRDRPAVANATIRFT